MQFEFRAMVGQAFSHGQNRRNADSAGEEQAAFGCMDQGEQVARFANQQSCADLDQVPRRGVPIYASLRFTRHDRLVRKSRTRVAPIHSSF